MTTIWAVGLLSGIIAASITSILQFLHGLFERRAADRRHLRDLALKAAIAQWQHEINLLNLSKGPPTGRDFDRILLGKLKLVESFDRREEAKPEAAAED